MTEQDKCAKCGSPLPASVRGGLCPACLLKRGLETNTVGFTDEDQVEAAKRWTPPTVEQLAPIFPELDILELIGRGGMGAVYKAREKQLDRLVALKILPPEIGREPAFAQRFAREAQAMAKLGHSNIVTIYSFGQRGAAELAAGGDLYFFIMEYVDGLSLRQLLDAGTVSPKEALAIVPQICDALQYAHDRGIVHRDIKPENILLNRAGQVKIADFGLAKLVGTPLPSGEGARRAGEGKPGKGEVTQAGEKVMGTPQYMAPEQIERPREVDHRADIYSLGVVFYQMLTGELPAESGQFEQRFAPPSRKVQIDVRLDEVVLRALEREPQRRYQQVSEVKTEVETIAASRPGETRHPSLSGRGAGGEGTPGVGHGRRSWRKRALSLAIMLLLVLLVRTFILGFYRVQSDAVSPEIPEGGRVFVYKLARTFQPGDIMLYRGNGRNLLGRVVEKGPTDGKLMIERRVANVPTDRTQVVAMADVIGKVVFNTRSNRYSATTFSEGFGPIVAVALKSPASDRRNAFFDLDSGMVVPLPESIDSSDQAAIQEWAASKGVDAVADTSRDVRGLLGCGMVVQRLDDRNWDEIWSDYSSDVVQKAIARATLARIKLGQPDEPGPGEQYLISGNTTVNNASRTYAFRTREGRFGILQLSVVKDEPDGEIRFRYRLTSATTYPAAQPPSTPLATQPTSGPASGAGVAPSVVGRWKIRPGQGADIVEMEFRDDGHWIGYASGVPNPHAARYARYVVKGNQIELRTEGRDEPEMVTIVELSADNLTLAEKRGLVFVCDRVTEASATQPTVPSTGPGGHPLPVGEGSIPTQPATRPAEETLLTRVYDIRDLIVLIPQGDAPKVWSRAEADGQKRPKVSQEDRQELISRLVDRMQEAVAPDSWEAKGGRGRLQVLQESQLVVVQTATNHERVLDLITQLRQARSLQLTIQSKFITLPSKDDAALQAWMDENLGKTPEDARFVRDVRTVPTDGQAEALLAQVQAIELCRTFSAPRLSLFDGQRASVVVCKEKRYDLPLISDPTKKIAMSFREGTILIAGGTVSADRKLVKLTLELSSTSSSDEGKQPVYFLAQRELEVAIPVCGWVFTRLQPDSYPYEAIGIRETIDAQGVTNHEVVTRPYIVDRPQPSEAVYVLVRADILGQAEEQVEASHATQPTTQPAVTEWRKRFEQVYRLDEGQVLKRVPLPFIPERYEYYRHELPFQWSVSKEAPDFFVFGWDSGALQRGSYGFIGGPMTLNAVLKGLGLGRQDYQGSENELQLEVPGDWIVRKGASQGQLLAALAEILRSEIGRDVRFERRMVERDLVVVRGKYAFVPQAGAHLANGVQVYAETLDADEGSGGGTGSLAEFLQWVGSRLNVPIIDQTDPYAGNISWYNNWDSLYSRMGNKREEMTDRVLTNLSRQTGLAFTRQREKVNIWLLSAVEAKPMTQPTMQPGDVGATRPSLQPPSVESVFAKIHQRRLAVQTVQYEGHTELTTHMAGQGKMNVVCDVEVFRKGEDQAVAQRRTTTLAATQEVQKSASRSVLNAECLAVAEEGRSSAEVFRRDGDRQQSRRAQVLALWHDSLNLPSLAFGGQSFLPAWAQTASDPAVRWQVKEVAGESGPLYQLTRHATDAAWPTSLWEIDPGKGYLAVRACLYDEEGRMFRETRIEPQMIEGSGWFPRTIHTVDYIPGITAEDKQLLGMGADEQVNRDEVFTVRSLKINQPIPDDTFTLKFLQLPQDWIIVPFGVATQPASQPARSP